MSTLYRMDIARLRYWQGQTLASADERDQNRFDALRWQLHNHALHAADGVSFGLGVTLASEELATYEVACGVAYDCRGRPLLLQRPRRIAVPMAPGWLLLRPRKQARSASSCCITSDPGCAPEDAELLDSDFELAWSGSASEPPEGVALARLDEEGGLDPDFRPRQARPLAKPRLARGETVRGDTPWEPWTIQEPDGKGGLRDKVVGVQTHIDTSAAGFTRTPCYLASIQSEEWNLATAEFAPAFFPHVANPTVDGFTFRLLMAEIARRRYSAWSGTARVAATTRGIGERLQVEVDAAAGFRKGDMIVQLRPRARQIVRVVKSSGAKLTLEAPLNEPGSGTSLLAVGNLPRAAAVLEVQPEDPGMVAAFSPAAAVKKGDVLLRTADGKLAVIDRVTQGKLTVSQPFSNWKTTDALSAARIAASVEVKNAALSTDGSRMSIELKPANHAVAVGQTLVLLDTAKLPFATTAKVSSRNGAVIEAEPVLAAAELAQLSRVAPAATAIAIQSLEPRSRTTLKVETVGPFGVGDVVSIAGRSGQVAVVEKINTGKKELELSSALDKVKVGELLVAANWRCATTVSSVDATASTLVAVGRADAAPAGAFVSLRIADDFSMPVPVTSVLGAKLTLAEPIAELKRLDTLAVGVFPGTATVVAQQPQEEEVDIAEPGRLAAGDSVVVVPTAGVVAPALIAQVVFANGARIVLSESLGALSPGRQLACVHWRDRVAVTSTSTSDPKQIEVDGDLDFRENDVVGRLAHYADNGNPGLVEKVEGKVLTLSLPGIEHGDGIVDQGWIDGGIVGPAAVHYPVVAPQPFPSLWQPLVRLDTIDGLTQPAAAVAYGLDLLSGRYVSHNVVPILTDAAGGHVFLWRLEANATFRYRPETLSLITSFNTEFPRAFATFAQKQKLSVRWTGCLREFLPASGCPGVRPHDPCDPGPSFED